MKSNQDHQRIAAAFERLFRTYGPLGQGSTPEEITRDRIERIKVYFEAVAVYHEVDVEAAVDAFLNGSAPGVSNRNYAPAAPMVGSEVRRQMNLRLDAEHRAAKLRPALPPPDIERTPESRARMKAILDAGLAKLQAVSLPENEAEAKRSKDQWDRVNAQFYPDMEPSAMRKRLGFTVGDPEGEADAA